jgi:hypothetical protein
VEFKIEMKMHNEELHKLHSSPNTIRMIKSRWMRWVGCSTLGGEKECIQSFGGETSTKETIGKTQV